MGQLQDQLLDLRKRHFTLLSYSRDLEQTKVVEHEHFQKQCEQKDREIINLKSASARLRKLILNGSHESSENGLGQQEERIYGMYLFIITRRLSGLSGLS